MTTNNVKTMPTFYGEKEKDTITVEGFIHHIEQAAQILKWDDAEKIVQLSMATQGAAKTWAIYLPQSDDFQNTWAYWKDQMVFNYGVKVTIGEVQKSIAQLQMTAKDTAGEFKTRIEQAVFLLKKTQPNIQVLPIRVEEHPILTDEFFQPFTPAQRGALNGYIRAVHDNAIKKTMDYRKMEYFMTYVLPEYRDQIEIQNPPNFIEAVKLLDKLIQQKKKTPINLKINEVQERDQSSEEVSTSPEGSLNEKAFEAMAAKYFNKFGNNKPNSNTNKGNQNYNKDANNKKPKKNGYCHFCNNEGHWQEDCRKRISENKPCKDRNGKYYQPAPKGGKRIYLNEAGMSNLDFHK